MAVYAPPLTAACRVPAGPARCGNAVCQPATAAVIAVQISSSSTVSVIGMTLLPPCCAQGGGAVEGSVSRVST